MTRGVTSAGHLVNRVADTNDVECALEARRQIAALLLNTLWILNEGPTLDDDVFIEEVDRAFGPRRVGQAIHAI